MVERPKIVEMPECCLKTHIQEKRQPTQRRLSDAAPADTSDHRERKASTTVRAAFALYGVFNCYWPEASDKWCVWPNWP